MTDLDGAKTRLRAEVESLTARGFRPMTILSGKLLYADLTLVLDALENNFEAKLLRGALDAAEQERYELELRVTGLRETIREQTAEAAELRRELEEYERVLSRVKRSWFLQKSDWEIIYRAIERHRARKEEE